MDEKLKKLMKHKSGKEMHPIEKEAKLRSLGDMHKQAMDMLGKKLGGIKKVSVIAPDKSGLEKGLSTAKSLLDGHLEDHGVSDVEPTLADHMSEETLETPEEEMEESPEEQAMEAEEGSEMHPEMSEMDIDEKIARLMEAKKRMLAAKK